jgi:hypothetical protein
LITGSAIRGGLLTVFTMMGATCKGSAHGYLGQLFIYLF